MKARFDELLPFYVNGSLSEADRGFVEDYLREHPKAAAELHWYQSLQKKLHDDAPAVSSEVGLERALHRIRTEGPPPARGRRPASPGWGDKLSHFFATLLPQPMLRPVLAGALAVVALQAAVIGGLISEGDDTSELRAVPPAGMTEQGPYLKVNFKPDAREADIRMLLVEVHGDLAAGPGQLGDYYVRVADAQQVAAVSSKLSASGIVDAVSVVDALPARK